MEIRKNSLLEKLEDYGKSDFYPFHMPGHKRQDFLNGFPDPYSIDITEIDGFDNLHHAEGILKESMERAAEIYGADQTCYLVNGSTCGILSAVCGSTAWGGKLLMARNCHKSAYHGLILKPSGACICVSVLSGGAGDQRRSLSFRCEKDPGAG
ncbi:MAG: hypothetical protein ACLUD2_21200 [Clostridium sp.]